MDVEELGTKKMLVKTNGQFMAYAFGLMHCDAVVSPISIYFNLLTFIAARTFFVSTTFAGRHNIKSCARHIPFREVKVQVLKRIKDASLRFNISLLKNSYFDDSLSASSLEEDLLLPEIKKHIIADRMPMLTNIRKNI